MHSLAVPVFSALRNKTDIIMQAGVDRAASLSTCPHRFWCQELVMMMSLAFRSALYTGTARWHCQAAHVGCVLAVVARDMGGCDVASFRV